MNTQTIEPIFKSTIDVKLVQKMGGDYMVVAAAKVSTCGTDAMTYAFPGKEEENKLLINYLMKCRHGTPFEHSALTFFVHAPIFVWREWHRHRIASYNEESARYKQLEPIFYIPIRSRPMMKPSGWKPGRPKFDLCVDHDKYKKLISNLKDDYTRSYLHYQENLDMGFDPGLARSALPVGIYSGCWVTCNPRSLMNFLSLRVNDSSSTFISYPLWEIEVAAKACEAIFKEGWPVTHKAFIDNGRVAP
jgi:thymidylate synthase (FAD)